MGKKKTPTLFEPLGFWVSMIQPLSPFPKMERKHVYVWVGRISPSVEHADTQPASHLHCLPGLQAPEFVGAPSRRLLPQFLHQCGSHWAARSKALYDNFKLNDFTANQSGKVELFDISGCDN